MSVEIIEGKNLDTILGSNETVLVNFSAGWCGPCKGMAPALEAVATQYAEQGLKTVKIDIDEDFELAGSFGIRSVPTLILFRNGEKVKTVVGAQSKAQLEKLVTA